MAQQIPIPECLGWIAESYSSYCSEQCSLTSLCVLMAIEKRLPTTEDYSRKPLSQRLGIKTGATMAVLDAPLNYWKLLGGLPDQVSLCDPQENPVDFIHVFVKDKSALKMRLERLKEQIAPGGMIWISWPKESSDVQTDLDENTIRELALDAGLINMSACVVDETWAAIRLVVPLNS